MGTFILLILSVGVATIFGQQQQLSPEITNSLLNLVTEERSLRAHLEVQTDALEKELDILRALRQNASCGCAAAMVPIAFSVTLTKDYTTFGKLQPVVFDKVDLNVGNAYDIRHGTFVVPVDGTYYFSFSMLIAAGKSLGVELVVNQNGIVRTRSGDDAYYTMGTNNVVLKLSAGDEVFIRHEDISDSNVLYGQSHTSFSGYLIEG